MFGSSFQVVFGNIFISKQCLKRTFKHYNLYISSCNFLSEVNEFFYDKLSKNLAMMEKKLKPSKTFIIQQIGSIGFVSILCIKNLPNNSNHLTQYVNYVVSKFTLFSLYWKPSKRENLLTA